MPQKEGKEEAIQMARERLAGVDLPARLAALELPAPVAGVVVLRAFGQDIDVCLADWSMTVKKNGKPAGLNDQILILHYLLCDLPVPAGTDLISYREFSGGQFYLQPFLSRTARPLAGRIGNDLALLKKNLDRFDWQPMAFGDFSARIHCLGNLFITLVYTLGDEEFPASCEILFDAATKRVYCTEDAAVLASRICIGLL
jgi:hypothetical protein